MITTPIIYTFLKTTFNYQFINVKKIKHIFMALCQINYFFKCKFKIKKYININKKINENIYVFIELCFKTEI